MRVAVVNIRKMPVTVLDFSMLMRMRMGLHAIPLEIVTVLVVFIVPMLVVMGVGPLLRWRRDSFARVRPALVIPALVALGGLVMAAMATGCLGKVSLSEAG